MLTSLVSGAAEFMSGRGSAIVLVAALVLGASVGLALPEASGVLSSQIDFTILLLVFLLLFEVRVQSILSSLNRIPFIVAALLANFVIIPAVGFAIASIFLNGHPLFLMGLVIYFMAPCTDWFLAFTRLAKGNTSLGAALLPINMIVQLLLYPLYLHVFGIDAVGTEAGGVFETLWRWFLAPLTMAVVLRFMLERAFRKDQLETLYSIVSILIPVALSLLIWQITAANISTLTSHAAVFPLILCAIFSFYVFTYLLSAGISKTMGLAYEDRALLTITTTARNAPLMLALTVAVIPDQPFIYAAIIIGMMIELPHLVVLKGVLTRQRDATRQVPLELSEETSS